MRSKPRIICRLFSLSSKVFTESSSQSCDEFKRSPNHVDSRFSQVRDHTQSETVPWSRLRDPAYLMLIQIDNSFCWVGHKVCSGFLWKNPNELFGQPNKLTYKHMHQHPRVKLSFRYGRKKKKQTCLTRTISLNSHRVYSSLVPAWPSVRCWRGRGKRNIKVKATHSPCPPSLSPVGKIICKHIKS